MEARRLGTAGGLDDINRDTEASLLWGNYTVLWFK